MAKRALRGKLVQSAESDSTTEVQRHGEEPWEAASACILQP